MNSVKLNDKHKTAMGLDLDGEEPVHDKLVKEGQDLHDQSWFNKKCEILGNRMKEENADPILTREEWYTEFLKPTSYLNEPSLVWPKSVIADIFNKGDNLYYVAYNDGEGKHVVFFTNNYFFTEKLGDSFVHVSTTTRGRAVPRSGCEDGIMNTPAKFKAVLHPDARYLYSADELIDFLDEIGRVRS